MNIVGVVVLAAAGALTRWRLTRLNRPGWPTGTLLTNVGASLALGVLVGSSSRFLTVIGVGLLGSMSTFSTVTAELVQLHDDHGAGRAAAYLAATLVLGVGAAAAGLDWAP